MAVTHALTLAEARRIAVRAQLLGRDRPGGLVATVRHLTLLQNEPTAAVAPNADLVAWSRLGASYSRDELVDALETWTMLELRGMIRPIEDIALYRAEMAAWPGRGKLRAWQEAQRSWVEANDACREDILARLRADGPLPSRELPDRCAVPWRSSGWTNHRNVSQLLELMVQRGEVAVAGRDGQERLWDLAERVYPDDPVVPYDQALRIRGERSLRAMGIARGGRPTVPPEPMHVGDAGEPAVIEGVKGMWRVDPPQLDRDFDGRAALLSPLDLLVKDRKRMAELFEFDYQLEMYKPAAQRRWGYYALPILFGDRLVGKLDAAADREAGVLVVNAVHRDVEFTAEMTLAVDDEIADLARWLHLEIASAA